jgi:hypothetical protein
VAINAVPVVAGGISCSNIVALFSAGELAIHPLNSVGEPRIVTTFTASGVARCFQKGAARTVTTT